MVANIYVLDGEKLLNKVQKAQIKRVSFDYITN